MTKITGTVNEVICTFVIISRWIVLRKRNLSYSICREIQRFKARVNIQYLFNQNHVVHEIMWDNMIQPERPHTAV